MDDKISDDHPSPTGKTDTVLDNSDKTMDSEKQALRSKDADAALEFLYAEGTTLMTNVDEKRLVRKIDWRIVPLMCRSSDTNRRIAIQLNKKISRGLLQPPISRQDSGELCQRNGPSTRHIHLCRPILPARACLLRDLSRIRVSYRIPHAAPTHSKIPRRQCDSLGVDDGACVHRKELGGFGGSPSPSGLL